MIELSFQCDLCSKDKNTLVKSISGLYSHVVHGHKADWKDYVEKHGGKEKVKAFFTPQNQVQVKPSPTLEGDDDHSDEEFADTPTPKPVVKVEGIEQPASDEELENMAIRMTDYLSKKGWSPPSSVSEETQVRPDPKNNGGGAPEISLTDPSLILIRFWLRAKNALWFDLAKNQRFGQPPLRDFPQDGNISDFINLVIEDYFITKYQANLGVIRKETV